jgi:hypothetical protein
MKLNIIKSHLPNKKWDAVFTRDNGRTKTVPFGAIKPNGEKYDDYTITKNIEQRTRYRNRHQKHEDHTNPMTAGALSYFILWGDSTSIKTNIKSFKERFNLS